MKPLTSKDNELIKAASAAISGCYDPVRHHHTVGAALRCGDRVYTGVNIDSVHSSCAEMGAISAAVLAGERVFDCIVAVEGEKGQNLLSPCGNCRQVLWDYMPDVDVIVETPDGLMKIPARDLVPYAYSVPTD